MQAAGSGKHNIIRSETVGCKVHRHRIAVAAAQQQFRVLMPVKRIAEPSVDPLRYIDLLPTLEGQVFKQEKGYEAYEYFDASADLGVLVEVKEHY